MVWVALALTPVVLVADYVFDVTGTPTMFINGRRISQTIDWPNLKNIIDTEIEYQKTAKNAGDDCGCEVKLDIPGMPQSKPPAVPAAPNKK